MKVFKMRYAYWIGASVGAVLVSVGCGGSDGAITQAPRIYVDATNIGMQDGTVAHPYAAIEPAISGAPLGTIVTIGPGTYTPTGGTLQLKGGVSIEGASAATTIIVGDLSDASTNTHPVSVSKLTFNDYGFSRAAPAGNPKGLNEVNSCTFHDLVVGYGGRANTTDKLYRFHVEGNSVSGTIRFGHGQGAATNTVVSNTVTGSIELSMGAGSTNIVSNNVVTGNIENRSGMCNATISGNTVTGQINDSSGCKQNNVIENNTVTYNGGGDASSNAAIVAKSGGVTIRNNHIDCTAVASGIIAVSGAPTNITGNTVTVPYAAVEGDADYPTSAILTKAGTGNVSNNIIQGGFYGIYDMSAGSVENNTITGAHHGLYACGTQEYKGNSITGCQGDGIVAMGASGPFTQNVVNQNHGAGVRVVKARFNSSSTVCDFGGGALSGLGGNTFTGNTVADFVVESLASDAATIIARNNVWDHSAVGDIQAQDIVDGHDSGALSVVDIGS
jgi:hypothetical protein